MRIRKNGRFSSLLALSYSFPSQPHVCKLNQSPWDVIRFSNDSFPPTSSFDFHPRLHRQRKRDDSLTKYMSFDKSLRAVDKKWKHEEAPDDNHDDEDDDDDNTDDDDSYYEDDDTRGRSSSTFGMTKGCCKRTNGKERQCSKEAKEGYYLRERQLKPRKNTSNSLSEGFGFVEPFSSFAKKGRRGHGCQGRPPKRWPLSKSPKANKSNLFYYYSEFNPLWGRQKPRRPRGGKDRGRKREQQSGSGTPPPSTWVSREEEEINYSFVCSIDEEQEEEGMDGDSNVGGRKRARRLVKAQPLKSLM